MKVGTIILLLSKHTHRIRNMGIVSPDTRFVLLVKSKPKLTEFKLIQKNGNYEVYQPTTKWMQEGAPNAIHQLMEDIGAGPIIFGGRYGFWFLRYLSKSEPALVTFLNRSQIYTLRSFRKLLQELVFYYKMTDRIL
jgi:hypothetical protein